MVNSHLTKLSTRVSIDSSNICNLLFNIKEYEIGNQLKRACTSVEVNIREAKHAENEKDFVHKLQIALKECNECIYWLDIIRLRIILESEAISNLYNNCYSILMLLKENIETGNKNPE